VVLVVLTAGACRVRTDIGVQVKDDGSGTVTVGINFDADAVKSAPNIESSLKVDDLTKSGWTVTQKKQTDGSLTFQAVKPFANPAEAAAIFNELSGPTGPLHDFQITRERSFARTTTSFTGTIDFSRGLESFGDSELAQQLDGKPIGDDIAAIEQRIGESLDKVFEFRVAVRLPGQVTSNAPGQAANGAVWQPKLSDKAAAHLEAKGRSWRISTVLLTGTTIAAVVALVILLLFRLAMRSQDKRRS
jgi:hypothetical protein